MRLLGLTFYAKLIVRHLFVKGFAPAAARGMII